MWSLKSPSFVRARSRATWCILIWPGARRNEPVTYIDERLRPSLERTLGVPLFQEQMLKIAMVMADFPGAKRRNCGARSVFIAPRSAWKVCVKLRSAMAAESHPEVADIVQAVQSFAVYGFPESHAISFALIAYASCWLKVHRTSEFYCALLNNQPMGFYSSATPFVMPRHTESLCAQSRCCTRSGFARSRATGQFAWDFRWSREWIRRSANESHRRGPFVSLRDFGNRVTAERPALRTLARIGALNGLVEHRRDGLWIIEAPHRSEDLSGLAADI